MNHIEYMRKIGAIGGSKGKDDPERKRLNRIAAAKSWTRTAREKRLKNILKKRLTKQSGCANISHVE